MTDDHTVQEMADCWCSGADRLHPHRQNRPRTAVPKPVEIDRYNDNPDAQLWFTKTLA